jgi:hypothetical protein
LKKEYWFFYLCILLAPVLVNMLMFAPGGNLLAVSDNAVWIGFFGSYLGGVISGILTLLGVRLTIKSSNDKEYMDTLPEKLLNTEEIILKLERQLELLNNLYKNQTSGTNTSYRDRVKFILQFLENDGLLYKSAKVNLTTYKAARRLYVYLKKVSYIEFGHTLPHKEINDSVDQTIKALKEERGKLEEKIDS